MKFKLKKTALKVLTDYESSLVGGGTASPPTPTGTECGATWVAECGTTGTETSMECTVFGGECTASDYQDCLGP